VHPAPPPKPTASKTTAPPPAAKPAPPVQTAALAAGVVPAPVSDEEPAVLAETADARLRITGVPLDGGVSLRFEWSESVKAAVFKLRNTVWIVFDHPERVSFNPRLDGGGAPMPALVQATNGSATVLHLPVAEDARLIVGRAGNAWLVDIRRAGPWEKDAPVVPGRALTAKDGLYATRKPAQPVTVLDPDSGEILLAVPVRTAGVHFADNEDHRTFHVLPTAQGMLFRPESDRLRIQIEDDGARVETAPDVVTSPVDR
jgi:hypothetical protein